MSAYAIYQVKGEYVAASDFGEGLGERRCCGIASFESAEEIARRWNEDAVESARIRKSRLTDGPAASGKEAQHTAEQPTDTTPCAAARLSLVEMEARK